MEREILIHLPVIHAVARRRGIASAAKELGMSGSAVSHAVRKVETRLGASLFARTTRSVALTEAGRRFIDDTAPALRAIGEAAETARASQDGIAGTLSISTSGIALNMGLTAAAAIIARRHPALRIELAVEPAWTDIVAGGHDAGVRLGEFIEADMVAVRLTPPFPSHIVAAPDYLERNGRPETIADLQKHACIGFRLPSTGAVYRWELNQAGREVQVAVPETVIVGDATAVRDLARAGVGLAYVFAPWVADDLADGRLEIVLPEASVEEDGYFLYFPPSQRGNRKLRALIEALREVNG